MLSLIKIGFYVLQSTCSFLGCPANVPPAILLSVFSYAISRADVPSRKWNPQFR